MSNERAADGAEVSAVEAPTVEIRNNPEASCWHDVLAIGPWFERASVMVFKVGGTVADEFPVDSNAIACDLHAIAGNSGDRLQERCATIGTGAAWGAVAALKRDACCVAFGTKLDKIRRWSLADDVEPARQRGCGIDANAKELERGVRQQKRCTEEERRA